MLVRAGAQKQEPREACQTVTEDRGHWQEGGTLHSLSSDSKETHPQRSEEGGLQDPCEIKSDTVSPSISHQVMGPDAMIFAFDMYIGNDRTLYVVC